MDDIDFEPGPEPDRERYELLNGLHAEFCAEMDKPGISPEKRKTLRAIAEQMFANEPDPYWRNQISLMQGFSLLVFEAAEQSEDPERYEEAVRKLESCLAGLHSHIDSIRPRNS
jgi:hypothetical protein